MVTGLQRAVLGRGATRTDRLLRPTAWGTGLSVLGPASLGLVTEPRGAVGGGQSQGLAVPWRCRAA